MIPATGELPLDYFAGYVAVTSLTLRGLGLTAVPAAVLQLGRLSTLYARDFLVEFPCSCHGHP